ncbi:MAG: PilW family protein [Bacillota bacterium]
MKDNKGFTLIEAIIVITILSLIVAALSGLFESSMRSWSKVNNQAELQHNLRFAINQITADIKNSRGIVVGSSENVIILQMSDSDTIKYGLKTDNLASEHPYDLEGMVLYMEKNGGNQEPVANFIAGLEFSYNNINFSEATYVKVKIEGMTNSGKNTVYESGAEVKWKSFGSLTQ